MKTRIGAFICAALCIVALAAVTASGASAFGNTTGYFCDAGGGGGLGTKFSDATCKTPAVGGAFGHGLIALGLPTELTLAKTGAANITIKTIVAGALVTLTAAGVECVGCKVENNEEVVGLEKRKDLSWTGSLGHLRFTNVTMTPATCKVEGEAFDTEPLEITSLEESGVLRMQFAPPEGSEFASIPVEQAGAKKCLVGEELPIQGFAKATTTGTIATFATVVGELHTGVNKTELKGEVAMSAGEEGEPHGPLALTEA